MSTEQNKQTSRRYPDHNPEEMDDFITQDFVGHGPKGFCWTLERHKKNWKEHREKIRDTIHEQIAEGDLVATRFTRQGEHNGKHFKLGFMSFKRFKDGKSAEIWEVWAPGEAE